VTTFIRILAGLIGSMGLYILVKAGVEDLKGWLAVSFCLIFIIYASIGNKLKGEGNFFTEDVIQAVKKDIQVVFHKDNGGKDK
jgi:hypothetical protein